MSFYNFTSREFFHFFGILMLFFILKTKSKFSFFLTCITLSFSPTISMRTSYKLRAHTSRRLWFSCFAEFFSMFDYVRRSDICGLWFFLQSFSHVVWANKETIFFACFNWFDIKLYSWLLSCWSIMQTSHMTPRHLHNDLIFMENIFFLQKMKKKHSIKSRYWTIMTFDNHEVLH